ncbi:hypothetical protein QVD17_30833 [Tagetes erecta]|uniref:Uncharacterized protein n=1 Tax=Tagetes erecta TaxID=13708 RepID=A0AAD8K3B3_TARER|nr:hypothetical protein QVD17_30833 [Tagetes erecta]
MLFFVHVMEDVMYDLGYGQDMDNEIPIYYHYLVPNEGLDLGLRALGNDVDAIRFSKYVGSVSDAFDAEMMENELFDSADESDDNEPSVSKRKLKAIRKQNQKSDGFYVGQNFESKHVVNKMLTYIVSTRRNIKAIKDDGGRNVTACTSEFLSEQLMEQVEENPHILVRAIKE